MKQMIIVLGLLLLVTACVQSSKVTCNDPYLLVGESCCLDRDGDSVCDEHEPQEAAPSAEPLDCSACPPKVVTQTEEVIITRYVCADGETVVDALEECALALGGPEPEYTPIMTNEDDQPVINSFTVRPACRGGYQAIEIYFDVGTAANDVAIQTKSSPDEEYSTALDFSSPVFTKYLYGVFCDKQCTQNADFFIKPGEKYLLRGEFDYSDSTWEDVFYSNEHVIDATADGEYMTKLC